MEARAETACAEGEARWARGDGPGAEAAFRQAVDLARPAGEDGDGPPGMPLAVLARARVGLGRVRLGAGDTERALVEFRRARDADPGGAAAPFWTGCALARQGDLAAADACFTEALDREDPHPRAAVQRAYVRAKSGRRAAALDDLRTAARAGALDDEARWVEAALGGGTRETALRLRRAALTALGGGAPDGGRSATHGGGTPDRDRAAALGGDTPEQERATTPNNNAPRQKPVTELAEGTPDQDRAAALVGAAWALRRERGAFVPLYAVTLVAGGRRDVALGLLDDATRHDPADHRVTHVLALALTNSPSDTGGSVLERCVGAWGALLHDAAFWGRIRRGAARRYGVDVPDDIVPDLRTALRERLARRLADGGAETDARVPPDLLLQREAEAARLLEAAGGLPGAPVRGGPLRVAALGAVRELGAFAAAREDDTLVHAFSELGFAHLQLHQGLPGDALAALGELRCRACRERPRPQGPGTAPVCEADCARFDELNPGYAGLADRRARLARDARDLALHARVTLGHDQLGAEPPDFDAAAASLRRALVHARELGRYRQTQAKIVGLVLATAKDAHRAGLIGRAVATLEAARTVIGANERPRIDGQLARALADRGIIEANREHSVLDTPAADLRRSVALSPHGRRAQLSLGIVLRGLALQRWGSGSLSGARAVLEEAVEALTAALAHFPDDPELAEERRRAQDELDFVREQFDESGR